MMDSSSFGTQWPVYVFIQLSVVTTAPLSIILSRQPRNVVCQPCQHHYHRTIYDLEVGNL